MVKPPQKICWRKPPSSWGVSSNEEVSKSDGYPRPSENAVHLRAVFFVYVLEGIGDGVDDRRHRQ